MTIKFRSLTIKLSKTYKIAKNRNRNSRNKEDADVTKREKIISYIQEGRGVLGTSVQKTLTLGYEKIEFYDNKEMPWL